VSRQDGDAGGDHRDGGASRELALLEVAPGPAGVAAVYAALPDALAGVGPALALAPEGSDAYAARVRAAVLGLRDSPDGSAFGAGGVVAAPERESPGVPGLRDSPDGHEGVLDPERATSAQGRSRDRLLVDGDVAVVLATSGSTGQPRGVLLPGAALLASAHAAYEHLGGPAAWLLALPVTGVGGLQVLVRSLVSQVEPVVLSSVGGASSFDPREFAAATWRLDPSLPAYTSLVPAQAARLLDDAEGLAALRGYEVVLLGGARTPMSLLDRLLDAHVAAITTYGMTETSGGQFYDGVALPGVSASILDADESGVGRIALAGPTNARGYLGDPRATAATFVGGRVLTNDVGRLHGAELEVLGRLDDVVQVGGVNVAVQAVEDLLASVSADACVLAAPDDTWGSRLTAYVAPSDATPDDDRLAALVTDALGRAAVPRTWVRLDALPHLPNGKPDRETLRSRT
jgi:O-succinylbenzoic acid--CoA ligase